jgi:hypothetical protein
VPLDGASDHGVSQALYLRDTDGNGLQKGTLPFDLAALVREAG